MHGRSAAFIATANTAWVFYLLQPFTSSVLWVSFFLYGENTYIAEDIISLGIIKVLFCCAKREGLYVSIHMRREYVPLMIQQKEEKPGLPSSSRGSC